MICLAGGLALLPAARAQDAAAARLEQQDAEERYRRLNATVEECQATLEAQRKRLDALVSEIRGLREDLARAATKDSIVGREEFRQLAETVREIDQKREADKRLILEEIAKLAKAPVAPQPRVEKKATPESSAKPARDENGYEHTVKSGETVSAIVNAFRDQGVKVTLKQVLDANPGLNPNKLKVGQKIFIPEPKP